MPNQNLYEQPAPASAGCCAKRPILSHKNESYTSVSSKKQGKLVVIFRKCQKITDISCDL